MAAPFLSAAVEGIGDEAVVRTLATVTGFQVRAVYVKGGRDQLDLKLSAYVAAARLGPWLVLRDLDRDADCPPGLIGRLLSAPPPPNLLLRIPVRSVESWLLADRPEIARFIGVPEAVIPTRPDDLPRPKRSLVDLARRSRRRELRNDIVPWEASSAEVGPGYTSRIIEFAGHFWSPSRAAERSPSLESCLQALGRLRSSVS